MRLFATVFIVTFSSFSCQKQNTSSTKEAVQFDQKELLVKRIFWVAKDVKNQGFVCRASCKDGDRYTYDPSKATTERMTSCLRKEQIPEARPIQFLIDAISEDQVELDKAPVGGIYGEGGVRRLSLGDIELRRKLLTGLADKLNIDKPITIAPTEIEILDSAFDPSRVAASVGNTGVVPMTRSQACVDQINSVVTTPGAPGSKWKCTTGSNLQFEEFLETNKCNAGSVVISTGVETTTTSNGGRDYVNSPSTDTSRTNKTMTVCCVSALK